MNKSTDQVHEVASNYNQTMSERKFSDDLLKNIEENTNNIEENTNNIEENTNNIEVNSNSIKKIKEDLENIEKNLKNIKEDVIDKVTSKTISVGVTIASIIISGFLVTSFHINNRIDYFGRQVNEIHQILNQSQESEQVNLEPSELILKLFARVWKPWLFYCLFFYIY